MISLVNTPNKKNKKEPKKEIRPDLLLKFLSLNPLKNKINDKI